MKRTSLPLLRREFITLLGGAAAWPVAAGAQQPAMRRIGVLMGIAEDDADMKARLATFRQGLERLGWSEGRNVRIDIALRPAAIRLQALAKELVALRPDVILAHSARSRPHCGGKPAAIPIVFVNVTDPIGCRLRRQPGAAGRQSHRPDCIYEEGISGKWLGLLKEIAPRLARAALVANPKRPRL